jgi:hypothetical protein
VGAVSLGDLLDSGQALWMLPIYLLIFGATFGLIPGLLLRVIVLIYPKDDPRRQELFGELYAPDMGRFERYVWVFQQLETALRDGLQARRDVRRRRKEGRKLRWIDAHERLTAHALSPVGALTATPPTAAWPPTSERVHSRRRLLVSLIGMALSVGLAFIIGFSHQQEGGDATVEDPPAGSRTVVVQNKVAIGSSIFVEDATPSYLSSAPVSRCVLAGCKLASTDVRSGTKLTAFCQTNEVHPERWTGPTSGSGSRSE